MAEAAAGRAPAARAALARAAGAFRVDVTFAVMGAVLLADTVALFPRGAAAGDPRIWIGSAASAVGWLMLGFRHRRPVAVAAVVLAAMITHYDRMPVDGATAGVAFMVALYSVAHAGRTVAVLALAGLVMAVIATDELLLSDGRRELGNMTIALLGGWFFSVVAFGQAMRARQAYQREAEQRALAAERERDVRARQSATEERLRIARELHDVLGHSISLISVQSGAALHRAARRPGETAELVAALESVRDTSKEALRELRATLGVLRQVDEAAPTAPAAGLERVGELAERAGAAGLRVTVATSGEPPVVPPQISLAAYRIVQESLTNVTRHAQAARASVEVVYAPGELRLRVEDDGCGAADGAAPGSGITGMAERARALGGELTARSTGSGFAVAARLPLPRPGAGPAAPGPAA
ncbi:sensor histidine kinase [Streptomyces capparidis]